MSFNVDQSQTFRKHIIYAPSIQVVYMDTEGNFRPERIEAIAERFGLNPNETLENIIVTRVFNHEQQIERAHVS